VQTFLPLPDFKESARVLDDKRLGKQRVEAYQVMRVLAGMTKGWRNHPAVLMWRDYEGALYEYGRLVCVEWRERGFNDSLLEAFPKDKVVLPPWLGYDEFHTSHQANLVRKLPEHYRKYFPEVDEHLPYSWPTKETTWLEK